MADFKWDDFPTSEEIQESLKKTGEEPSSLQKMDTAFDWESQPTAEQFDANRYVSSLTPTKAGDLINQLEKSAKEEKTKLPEVGMLEAAGKGITEGVTFGTSGEIAAPLVAASGMIAGAFSPEQKLPTLPGESTYEKFKRLTQLASETAREREQAAQKQHPGTYMTGKIAGGMLTPGVTSAKFASQFASPTGKFLGGMLGGSIGGAVSGGATAFGESQGTIEERLPETLVGAGTGAVVGGALPVAGRAVQLGGKSIKGLGNFFLGKTAKEAYKQGSKGFNVTGEDALSREFGTLYNKSGDLVQDIDNVFTKTGEKINEALKQKESSRINLKKELEDTFDKLNKMKQTEEGAKYANDIESELNYILGRKPSKTVKTQDLPEGLLPQRLEETIDTDLTKLTPQQAQDIKQIMFRYSPSGNFDITPQQFQPAKAAGDLSAISRKKLSDLSPELAEANKQWAAAENIVERLKLNRDKLPEQQTSDIAKLLNNLEKGNLSGYEAQKVIEDVVSDLKVIDPELATKYGQDLSDIAKRIDIIRQLQGASNYTKANIFKRLGIAASNITGRGVNKVTGLGKESLEYVSDLPVIKPTIEKVAPVAKEVLTAPNFQKSLAMSAEGRQAGESFASGSMKMVGIEPIKGQEYYKRNKRIAQAAENADPELLKSQAQQIRKDNGSQGEQLAQILENMADKEKDARRALMFTVLQNPAYRKMLGLTEE